MKDREMFNLFMSGNRKSLPELHFVTQQLQDLIECVKPIPFYNKIENRFKKGAYLRTDYWNAIISGGSYGHTCYVAKELSNITDNFTCYMASHFSLLDELSVKQVNFDKPFETCNESDLLRANNYYFNKLFSLLKNTKPNYLYERLCLGNFVGAWLSIELKIPYIIEYNGSEISMIKSFSKNSYKYPELLEKAEDFSFKQATVISVISKTVFNNLVERGVDKNKILINPNCVDPKVYAPQDVAGRNQARGKIGLKPDECVIGFIGTFGGWHGIEVLAKSIPLICRSHPHVRWLMIGDGVYKYLIESAIHENNLQDTVILMGNVPQQEGARLLKLCDIFVSPHSSHMLDSPFFGSPTKLFEYMSLGGGIVASDLEQIGEILTPALKPNDFQKTQPPSITNERAVLCKPGDINEFIEGTLGLIRNLDIAKKLGTNARNVILNSYTWQFHINRLINFINIYSCRIISKENIAKMIPYKKWTYLVKFERIERIIKNFMNNVKHKIYLILKIKLEWPLNFIKFLIKRSIFLYDRLQSRLWEYYKHLSYQQPSDGKMTIRLSRMKVYSFKRYTWKQMIGHYGTRNFLPTDRHHFCNSIERQYPGAVQTLLNVANKLVEGKFNFFGCNWVDLKRNNRSSGWKIDWQKDPVSGLRYSKVFSHWTWDVFLMRPGNADVKGPWELSRCQHFATLGQAYWLTGDEKYAECFAKTIKDFIKTNPPGFGVHWACTMDVGLRIVGWLSALSFFQGSKHLNFRWWSCFLKSLVEHGEFIVSNLEYGTWNGKIIVSNHGIANLLGLYWLSLNFPALDAGCVWRGIAETGLEQQIQLQILPDGGDFESSIPYHRLVVEMFLSAYALSLHAGLPLSEHYRDRLFKALIFLKTTRQTGGRQPQLGDADDGRAHIFSDYGKEMHLENMDHLLVAGAKVLNCPDLSLGIEGPSKIESLFWNVTIKNKFKIPTQQDITIFPEFGAAILRKNSNYVLLSNSKVGTLGIGNHKHNDQLAIEWALDNQPIFVDGGSFTYTQDPNARNTFRSTATHNTVMINDQEQHKLDPLLLFKLEQNGDMGWNTIKNTEEGCYISGWHTAYHSLENPVTHFRNIYMDRNGLLLIDDNFEGLKNHLLRWNFLVHPSLTVMMHNKHHLSLKGSNIQLNIFTPILEWRLEDAWYSPGYNRRLKTKAIVSEHRITQGNSISIICAPATIGDITLENCNKISKNYFKDYTQTYDLKKINTFIETVV